MSKEDTLNLCSILLESEVIQALSSLGSSKAPGPDGFTAFFYKKYRTYVSKDVLACVRHFFQNHHMLQELNHTFITLVPKKTGSHFGHHFRPISLCNISYKIISKILANRLKKVLPKIISPLQSAFVPNRNIQDKSILAHELIHTFKNKKGKRALCFSKWTWKKHLIKWKGSFLGPSWRSWGLMILGLVRLKPASPLLLFSILINGSPFGLISPAKRLRQRDPFSSFLFILESKVLSRLMYHEASLGHLKWLKIAKNNPAINHLLFANDLLIFGQASLSEALNIKSCLAKYCSWSGQSINIHKSSISFSKYTNRSYQK